MLKNLHAERLCNLAKALALIGAAHLAWPAGIAAAQERPAGAETRSGGAQLEKAFWACDYAGTTGGVDVGTAVTCVAITERLKNERFGGDFGRLLQWWQVNKAEQHRLVAKQQ